MKAKTMHKKEELLEIESQLSFPTGENGIKIAHMMNETNITMTRAGIECLCLSDGDKVLELGHGNGKHIHEIIESGNCISFSGLEISETMKSEAEILNKNHIAAKKVSFCLYDGIDIPFTDNEFSKILTVNTLYFWNNPKQFIKELARVLKPNGICSIAFSKKEFLDNLPFVQSKFTLYSNKDVINLAQDTDLVVRGVEDYSDFVKSKDGENVLRKFSVVSFSK